MSDLQWQKDRCIDWLLVRWASCVPPERTKEWLNRIGPTIQVEQVARTMGTLSALTDDQLSPWLLEAAEPWQQSLLLTLFQRTIRAIEGLTEPGDVLIEAIALHVRDGDSLRSILLYMLQSCLPDQRS